jgi:hypothetical protein
MTILGLFWFVPSGVTGLACALGYVERRAHPGWTRVALALLLVATMLTLGVVAANGRDPDVTSGDFILGVAIAVVAMGAIPIVFSATLGYVIRNPIVVALVWFVFAIALGFYLVIGALIVAELVSCPEDAYECPL